MNKRKTKQMDDLIKDGCRICLTYEPQRTSTNKYVGYMTIANGANMHTGNSFLDLCDKLIYIYSTNNWFGYKPLEEKKDNTEWDELLKAGYSVVVEKDHIDDDCIVGKLYMDNPSIFNISEQTLVKHSCASSFAEVMDEMVQYVKDIGYVRSEG